MQFAPDLIIPICWLIFLVFWLISSFFVKAIAERKSFASSLPYRIPLIIGAVVLWHIRWGRGPMNLSLTPCTMVTLWAGAVISVAGLFITLWARVTLGSNWSSEVRFKQGHELIKTGPYRFVRHPIYTGILLMCLAIAIAYGRLHHWLGVCIIVIGLWIKLKQEEEVMRQHFPDYPDYCKHVKALVPFII